jgi:hypothetical protein
LGAATSVADLRSMMKRSARMLVKKLMNRLIRGQRSGTAALIVRS